MPQATPHDLKHQFRQCAHCKKSESCNSHGHSCGEGKSAIIRFRVCGRCKIHRYCSTECQRADWPIHKSRCNLSTTTVDETKERDALAATWTNPIGGTATLPLHAIYPLLHGWTTTYRPLMILSLLNAIGLCDGPPASDACSKPAQLLFIKMSVVRKISSRTKARAAFLVDDAEALSVAEFSRAVVDHSHRLYHPDNVQLMADYDRYKARMNPHRRLSMVVQRTYFHNGVSAMMYNNNWYYEDDYVCDYSMQWKPDDWLSHLQENVAAGKGWNRDDVHF